MRRFEILDLVPFLWIGSQQAQHNRDRVFDIFLGLPTDLLAGSGDVQLVVAVGDGDHPRLDKGFLHEWDMIFKPGHDLGWTLRDLISGDLMPVQKLTELPLQLIETKGDRFADHHDKVLKQIGPTFDGLDDRSRHIIQVQVGGPVGNVSRENVRLEASFEDTGRLLRDRDRVALVIVTTGDPHDDNRDMLPFIVHDRLGFDLRFRIGPLGVHLGIFVDLHARPGRLVDEHRTDENELFDLEILRRFQ